MGADVVQAVLIYPNCPFSLHSRRKFYNYSEQCLTEIKAKNSFWILFQDLIVDRRNSIHVLSFGVQCRMYIFI